MQQATILNLKWDTFSSQLTNCLDLCYEKEYFVDLSLVCKNGATLKCHKMVLSNGSSFFRRLLVKNEHPHPMIILHDIEADDLKTIVNFMYCGEVQVMKSEVRRILKIAEALEVSGLKDILKHEGSKVLLPKADGHESRGESSETECPLKTTEPKSPTKNKMAADISNSIESSFQKMAPNGRPNSSNGKSRYNFRTKKVNVACKEDNVETSDPRPRSAASDTPNVVDGNEKSAKKRIDAEERLSWNDVLDEISEEGQSSLKRLCLMNEIEISAMPSKSPKVPEGDLGPNNVRAQKCSSMSQLPKNCMVYIKDELDIPCDWEFKSNAAENEKYNFGERNPQTVNSAFETFKKTPRIVETVSVSPKSVMRVDKRKSMSGPDGTAATMDSELHRSRSRTRVD